jgi:hypothetical protein
MLSTQVLLVGAMVPKPDGLLSRVRKERLSPAVAA